MLRYAALLVATSLLIACGGQNNPQEYARDNTYVQPEADSQQVLYCDCSPYSDSLSHSVSSQYVAGFALKVSAEKGDMVRGSQTYSELENKLSAAKSLGRKATLTVGATDFDVQQNHSSPQQYFALVHDIGEIFGNDTTIGAIHLPFGVARTQDEVDAVLNHESLPALIETYRQSFPLATLDIAVSIGLPTVYLHNLSRTINRYSPNTLSIRLVVDGTANDASDHIQTLLSPTGFPEVSALTITAEFLHSLNSVQRVEILSAVLYRAWKDNITVVELPEDAIGSASLDDALENQSRLSSITSLAH